MSDEQFGWLKEVLLEQLATVKEAMRIYKEDEQLLQYQNKVADAINVIGEVEIVMDQKKDIISAGHDYIGGDRISQRARDMRGVAVGRGARSEYSESTITTVGSPADLSIRINELVDEVSNGELPPREKAPLLAALIWWSEHAQDEEKPDDAEKQLSPIETATGWVKEGVGHILSSATGAIASHWAVELVKQLIQ